MTDEPKLPVNWRANVECSCGSGQWTVVKGVWTCDCDRQMTVAAISRMQRKT